MAVATDNLTISTNDPYNIGNYGGALSAGIGATISNPDPYNIMGSGPGPNPYSLDVFSTGATSGGLVNQQSPGLLEQAINFLGNNAGTIAGGLGGGLAINNAINRLQQVGDLGYRQGQGLGSTLYDATQFRPYTVTTPTGASFTAGPATGGAPTSFDFGRLQMPEAMYLSPIGVGGDLEPITTQDILNSSKGGKAFTDIIRRMPVTTTGPSYRAGPMLTGGPALAGGPIDPTTAMTGTDKGNVLDPNVATPLAPMQYTSTLSPREQAFYQGAFGGAGSMFGSALEGTEDRTRAIYGNMLDVMRPEMERQRLTQEERMAAQGRLGLSSNLYGGMAPEDFQLNRAQQEAMSNAYLGAMEQARGEQLQQANIGNLLLGASYVPQAQMLNAIQPGMGAAAQEQAGRLTGAGMFGESYASGIDALLASAMGQSNLMGSLGSGLLSGTLQGATMGRTGESSDAVNYYNILKDIYDSYIRG